MKEFHRVAPLGSSNNNKEVAINSLLLRNYNDGRTGGWNNYCCYQGQGKGSYVNEAMLYREESPIRDEEYKAAE
jgi:hypothetical protein